MRVLVPALCAAFLLVLMPGCRTTPVAPAGAGPWPEETVRILTFNILKGGTELGQPISQTVRGIRLSGADVVILQEVKASLPAIADALGWESRRMNDSVAMVSRFEIAAASRYGVALRLPSGRIVWVFGVHLEAYPYGPYDLRDDRMLTDAELIRVADATRGHQIAPVLDEITARLEAGYAVFLGGDFNEASHLDWGADAAAAGLNFGMAVAWPTSTRVHSAGLHDSFRALRPDAVEDRGDTWTPIQAPGEVHDRIDLLYHAGPGVKPVEAFVLGEHPDHADIVLQPYPTDHRGVVVEYRLGNRVLRAHTQKVS